MRFVAPVFVLVLSLILSACGSSSEGPNDDGQEVDVTDVGGTLSCDNVPALGEACDWPSSVECPPTVEGAWYCFCAGGTWACIGDGVPTDVEVGDPGEDTTEPDDGGGSDEGITPLDEGPGIPEVVQSVIQVEITAPEEGSSVEFGTASEFTGTVHDSQYEGVEMSVVWSSDIDSELCTGTVAEDGSTSCSVPLDPGPHVITLMATNPLGQSASDTISVGVCTWQSPDNFDTNIEGSYWQIYGDAYWDSNSENGWLEMTGIELDLQSGKRGAIFNTVEKIFPNDVQIQFKIATGGGVGGGADGFAMSVIDAGSVAQLETYLATNASGGCLGYGWASPACGGMELTAFHVEIDTFHNNNNPITDPTTQNHIGVMLNGDAGTHHLWAAVPNVEDLAWHEVVVSVTGTNVVVSLDGNEIINGEIPELDFRGGYIGFTGTTGGKTNYHRFDELQIIQECIVSP